MAKRLIQQARGRGGPTYRAPSFRYIARVKYPKQVPEAIITDIIKCPGHSAPLAEIRYNNETDFVLASEGIRVGDKIEIGENVQIKNGNITRLKNIPEGASVFNIEHNPGDGGKFVRASGGVAKILAKQGNMILVLLPSKKEKFFQGECMATIGMLAGSGRPEKPFLKAGTRYMAMRARNKLYPLTSGVSMNVVDHPFGSGRGSHKGRPTIARRFAPPGAKVGMLHPRRSGRKKR